MTITRLVYPQLCDPPSGFQAPSLWFPVKSPPGAVSTEECDLAPALYLRAGAGPGGGRHSWQITGLAHLLPLLLPEPPNAGSEARHLGPVQTLSQADPCGHRPPASRLCQGRAGGQSHVLGQRQCWHSRRFACRAPVPREDAVPPLAAHPKVFPRRVLRSGLMVPSPGAPGAEPPPHQPRFGHWQLRETPSLVPAASSLFTVPRGRLVAVLLPPDPPIPMARRTGGIHCRGSGCGRWAQGVVA